MKIKKVRIKAFRLFEDVSVDLTTRKRADKAANFVAIYAPNGFGKTSFFDAMEFCMTKSIHRVKSNFKENFSMDQKQGMSTFIHNKDFPNDPIDITMSFEDHDEVKTICYPNEECAMLKKECTNNTFFRDAILSQDWLSEFLSSKSSADRFKIFMQNFEETNTLLNYYQKLGDASRGIKRRIEQMGRELKQLNKNIDKKINNNVVDLLKQCIEKMMIYNLDIRNYSAESNDLSIMKIEAESIYSNLTEEAQRIKRIIANLNKALLGADGLIKFSDIGDWIVKFRNIESALKDCTVIIEKIKEWKGKRLQLEQYNLLLSENSKKIHSFSYLIDNCDLFLTICKTIAEKEKKIEELVKQKREKEYYILREQLEKKSKILLHERQQLQTIENDINALELRHASLLKLISDLQKNNIYIIPNLYEEEIRKLLERKDILNKFQKALRTIEYRVEEKTKLNDNIQNLLASSQSIVEHLKGSRCPLCGFDYESHQNLLNVISNNTILDSSLKEDIEDRENLRKIVEDREHVLNIAIRNLIHGIENSANNVVTEKKELNTRYNTIKSKIEQLTFEKNKIEESLSIKFSDANECLDFSLHKSKDVLLMNNTNQLQKEIEKNNKIIADLKKDEFYIQYFNLAQTDEISQETLNEWEKNKKSIQAKSEKLKYVIEEIKSQILSLNKEGIDESKEISIQQKQTSLTSEYTETKNLLTSTYYFLKNNCYIDNIAFPLDYVQIEAEFQNTQKETREKLQSLTQKISIVGDYINTIALVIKYSENEQIKKQYETLKNKQEKNIENKEIIDGEKERLENHLKRFVEGFFQIDIINRLYNTIDPHPEYKKIRFECDFSLKEPRLNVLMYSDTEDRENIVPNLYFSTAQINILSFCIFMGKALFAKTDKQKDLGCIFIDDPIQALDDINILSMIDLLRNIAFSLDKQIVLTTHNKNFFELLKMKVPEQHFSSKFIEFKQRGVIE